MNEVDELLLQHFDVILDHSGVKGMKWGVRKRARIDRTISVGRGKKGALNKARVYSKTNPIDLIKTGSLRKSAARKGKRMTARNARLATKGQAKVRDYLVEIGTARYTDIFPSFRSKKLTADQRSTQKKMSSGKALAIAAAIPVTMYAVNTGLRIAAKTASNY